MRRSRKAINQINVVPYIDVMLVLLVIFMITAPLVNPGQIELPTVGTKLTAAAVPLRINIGKNGALSLQDGTAAPVTLSRDDLVARVRARQAAAGEQPVVIGADRGTRYEEVIGVIDMLQRNGIHKVGLLARQDG
jgi:biopolymer transport protein TolR